MKRTFSYGYDSLLGNGYTTAVFDISDVPVLGAMRSADAPVRAAEIAENPAV